jgi:uncharacterized membrane protein
MGSSQIDYLALISIDNTQEELITAHVKYAIRSFHECSWVRINLSARIRDHLDIIIALIAIYHNTSFIACEGVIAGDIGEIDP